MQLEEAIQLISNDALMTGARQTWADLGCGDGLFTYALASFLAPGSTIYAVDKRPSVVANTRMVNNVNLNNLTADFINDSLPFASLDGILMANSLHYVPNMESFIKHTSRYLRKGGRFIIVEYDTNEGNTWVPFPVQFSAAVTVFSQHGFSTVKKLGERPSRYNSAMMYAALVES